MISKRQLWALGVLGAFVLSGCGDPLRDVERLSAVDLAVAEAANIAVEPQTEAATRPGGAGFLGRLFGRDEAGPAVSTDVTDVASVPSPEDTENAEGEAIEIAALEASETLRAGVEGPDAAPARRGGLFGLFRRSQDGAEEAETVPDPGGAEVVPAGIDGAAISGTPDGTETDDVTAPVPEVEPETETTLAAADAAAVVDEAPRRRGLFGRLLPARAENTPPVPTGPDAIQVPEGMAVPYGRIATNCAVGRRDYGSRIARQSGFEIWDTAPGSTDPRTHYITGFGDNCARQFTGALVIMGDVGTHEVVRYSDVNIDLPWSETDQEYERIKRQVCGVSRSVPCGARLEQLGARTAFITVYERFGSGPEWVEILLHDGAVVAIATEGL